MVTYAGRVVALAVLTVVAYAAGLAGGARGTATEPGAERHGL